MKKLIVTGEITLLLTKIKTEIYFLCCVLTLIIYVHPQGDRQTLKKSLSWIRLKISCHRFRLISEWMHCRQNQVSDPLP